MKLEDLKNLINDHNLLNTYPDDYPCFIFVYEDNPFVALQYVNALAEAKEMETRYVSSLEENSFFEVEESTLSIYNTLSPQDIKQSPKNTIILCSYQNEIDKLPQENLVKFPALKDWQIKDYISVCCPGLKETEVDFVYSNSQGDIYKIQIWIDKLKLFDKMVQSEVLQMLIDENNYFNYDPWLVYKLASAIMKKNKEEVASILSIPNVTFEPFGFLNILRRTLYNIMCIQMDGTTTAESLGLKYNQFKALSYSCNKFSNQKLIELFKFLNEIDSEIKLGKLLVDEKQLLDYVIVNMWR